MEVIDMAKDVRCNVESCKYNCNKKCEANVIQVSNCCCHDAKDCEQTSCDTFELK